MSYQVLARRHRPSTFEEVVGQEHITQTLAGALATGRLAHAFIFTGPRGVGKTTVARILAKALNCSSGPTDQPCADCAICADIQAGTAVDVQEIDAASNSRVEDVRELREMIRFRPQAARYRVTILDEVHMLSKAAFNALLKTLEEPPSHAVFILATTDVHKVPLTILSRCQRYDFRRLPPHALAVHLEKVLALENCRLPQESLMIMSREADGSVRDALSLLDQVLSLGREEMTHQEVVELLGLVDREMVRATAQAVMAGDAGRVLELVESVYGAGGEMQTFYAALQEHFRNLAAAQAAPDDVEFFGLTREELAELKKEAATASPETLHETFDQLARSEDLFRRASQPRLVMEMTLLRLTQLKPVLSLEEIITRLAAAAGDPEGGVPGPAPPAGSGAAHAPKPSASWPSASPEVGAPSLPAQSQANRLAPAGEPPPRTMPGAEAALKELSRFAGATQPSLAAFLGRSSAQKYNGHLKVTLPPGPLARGLCNAENESILSELLGDLFVDALPVGLESAHEEAQAGPPPEVARATDLAEHSAVREALEVFEASVVQLDPEIET